jgi:hypothetical protein
MSEYYTEPTLPYDTYFFREWCDAKGVDREDYKNIDQLWLQSFLVAKLRSEEIAKEMALRQTIKSNLPLDGSRRIEEIGLKPEFWGTRPKMFEAPAGMAFQIEVTQDVDDDFMSAEGFTFAPLYSETKTVVGELLKITTYTENGDQRGIVTVYERPNEFAVPVYNDGDPQEPGNTIYLPSRFNADEDGGAIAFARLDDWEVVRAKTGKLGGHYEKTKVSLVPFDTKQDDELYVADFDKYNDFALDDFIFVDEQRLQLPPGFGYMQTGIDRWELRHMPVNNLILPPIPQADWTALWEDHGIMIKLNPTVHSFAGGDSRFQHLDFSGRRSSLEFAIRQFNSKAERGQFIMRALAIHGLGGTVSLDDALELGLSKELLDEEDERFI